MRSYVYIFLILIHILSACRNEVEKSSSCNSGKFLEVSLFDSKKRVKAFEDYIKILSSNLSDEERHQIRDKEFKDAYKYLYMDFDWNALAERTFSQQKDEWSQICAQLGVYGGDLRGEMLRVSLIRSVNGKPMGVKSQASTSRKYWQKNEGVRPPEIIECPLCGKVMRLLSMGKGYDRMNPKLWIFTGDCANEHRHMYDQLNGWRGYE